VTTLWLEGVTLPTGNGAVARKASPDTAPRYDVHHPGGRETVTLTVLTGVASCTCGKIECAHIPAVRLALAQRNRRLLLEAAERLGAEARQAVA
jgi:hypothetical protein